MNVTYQIILLIVLLAVCVIGLLYKLIDWRELAIKWVGNNPARSQHYIASGDTVRTVEGRRFYYDSEAMFYAYRLDGIYTVVPVPRQYPEKYIHGNRIIGQQDGVLVPDPLGFMTKLERDALMQVYHDGGMEVSGMIEGNVHVKAIQSVKNNRGASILLWAVVAIVVVAGILYYVNSANKPVPAATGNVTAPARTAPAPTAPNMNVVP